MREDVDALGVSFRSARVFIVDDEAAVLDLLSGYIEGEGYDVRTFTDPLQALSAIAKYRPEVVLADLQMPVLPGLELMTRAAAVSPDSCFIIITAFTTVDTLIEAIRFGVHDYLTKPFSSPDAVRLVVRNAHKKRSLETLNRMQATVTGTILKLSEVSCLGDTRDAFFSLAGRVLSRILEAPTVASVYRSGKDYSCHVSTEYLLSNAATDQLLAMAMNSMGAAGAFARCNVAQELSREDITAPTVHEFKSLVPVAVMGLEGVEAQYVVAHPEAGAFRRDAVKMALSFARSVTLIAQRHFMGATHEHQMIVDLLHHLRDGVVVVDKDYAVRFVNPQARKILGVIPEAELSVCLDAVDSIDPSLAGRGAPSGFSHSVQKQVAVRVEGHELFFDVQVYAIQTPTKVAYRVIIFRDVTHLRRERSRIEALNVELKNLNRELTDRASRLEAVNKELDSFAYIASHDLQEPFRHIEIFVQFLERDLGLRQSLPDDILYLLQQISKNVDVAKRLLSDLRTLSRVTRMRNPYRRTSMVDLVEEVLQRFSDTVQQKGARVVVEELPEVVCDAIKMKEVFHNLVSNALKYNESESPRIAISATQDKGEVTFCVEDNGIGIEPEYFEYVFQACRRIPHKGEVQGSGLGLAIVRKIIEEHGGRVWVESEVGKGSRFLFMLPNRPE
jgi:signal transduction histidine kinase/FixJ family two-component response regulator